MRDRLGGTAAVPHALPQAGGAKAAKAPQTAKAAKAATAPQTAQAAKAATALQAAKAATAASPSAPKPPRLVTSVEGITEYALDNGLRVLLFADRSKPTLTVNVTYFVGSRHEGYGESGMAHLLEHMVFKGTPRHPKIWEELQAHGARFNGTTWVDRTNYFETMPASDENLRFALDLEADRMVHSNIAASDLQKEFSVVRNEFERGENSPSRVLEERLLSSAYVWHNYGKSTIGSKSDIERVPVDNLRAFYQRFYQPDNALLVVAGKFEPDAALRIIQDTFGALPRPTRTLSPTYTVEPIQDGERTVTLRRAGDVGIVALAYHGVASTSADFVAEEALVDALTNRPAGRLYKALVETKLAARVGGDAYAWAEPGVLQFAAEVDAPTEKRLAEVEARMLSVVESITKSPVTDEEVNRWRTNLLAEIELSFTDPNRIGVELSEWAASGDWRTIFVHRDRVEKVTAAEVNAFAAAYLKRSNRTLGRFVPEPASERAPLPAPVDVAALVQGYKGRPPVKEGESFEATPANVDRRTETLTLPSGMKVALLPKRTRGEAVHFVLRLHVGDERALTGRAQDAASLVLPLLFRGTQKRSYQQLQDDLARLKADVSPAPAPGFDPGSAGLRVLTTRANLPEVLAIVAEMLTQPGLRAPEFEALKRELLALYEKQLQEPQALAMSTALQKAQPFSATDVRYQPTPAERIARLQPVAVEDVASWYKQRWGGSSAELAVVGDFDPTEVKRLLGEQLGSWKSPAPYVRVARTYQDKIPGSEQTIRTPDKPMAFVGVAHAVPLREDDEDFATLRMVNFVLGGSAKSRLFDRLRQKEGISYGTFSNITADPIDPFGGVMAGAICAKENAGRAMALLLEEIDTFLKSGVDDQELSEAKRAYQLAFDNQLAQDDFVAAMLTRNLHLGRTFDYWAKLNARIAALTPSQVLAAARKHIEPSRLIRVLAGDLPTTK
jgi:zinc protease